MVSPSKAHSTPRKPIVLTVAQTGAAYSAEKYPNIPVTPEAVIRDAKQCFDAGARVFHVHARNPKTGQQFANLDYYKDVKAGIRRQLGDVPLIFPTSRKGEVEFQIEDELRRVQSPVDSYAEDVARRAEAELLRGISLYAEPDRITTFTAPDILIGGRAYQEDYAAATASYSDSTRTSWKDPAVARAYYRALTRRTRERGISEEIEVSTWGAFDVLEGIGKDPTLSFPPVLSIVLLPGFSARLPISKEALDGAMERVDRLAALTGSTISVTVAAVIPPPLAYSGPGRRAGDSLPAGKHDYREVIEWIAEDPRVASFRVGLEDTPELFGEKLTNAGLVDHARRVFDELGIMTELNVSAVRRTIGLEVETGERLTQQKVA